MLVVGGHSRNIGRHVVVRAQVAIGDKARIESRGTPARPPRQHLERLAKLEEKS